MEASNVLVRAERKKIIPVGQAAALPVDLMSSDPVLSSYLPLLSRATEIASQMRCGVYDCLYVALAEKEGCELVTADDKLVKNLGTRFPLIISLASMPG